MKYAIVTGASKGIGKSIALQLESQGYYVYGTYSDDLEAADEFKKDIKHLALNMNLHQVNHEHKAEVLEFCEFLKKSVPKINCIVCNVGHTLRKDLTDISDEDFECILQVSLLSHHAIIRELFQIIPENSRIIFIGSLMAIHPHSLSIPYGVSKAAVHAYALNLVKYFEGNGTTVNVIAPGFVETEWQKEKPEEIRQNIYNKTAVKRFATVDEISDAVLFCVNNGFVNGSILEVSGGYSYK